MSAPESPPSGKRPHESPTQETGPTEANGRTKRRRPGVFQRTTFAKRNETVFRILCPASKSGSIIGKAGSIIKAIRNDTGAMIRVEDAVPGSEERVVTITAKEDPSRPTKYRGEDGQVKEEEEKVEYLSDTDEDQEEHVEIKEEGEGKEVAPKEAKVDTDAETKGDLSPAQEALLRVHLRIVEADPRQPEDIDPNDGELKYNTRLLVPSSQVGCLLGKRGRIIEQMRNDTGAQIRVLPKDQLPLCAAPTDEVVQITGDLVAVRKALHAASCRLRDNPPKEQNQEFGSGFPVGVGRLQSAETLSKRNLFSMGNMVGAHGDIGRPSSPQHAFGPSTGAFTSGYGSEVHFVKEDVTFRILCPKEKIGSIIGKGGNIIRNLREETGAKISIDVSASEGDERVVCISAMETSEDTFSKAQNAISIVHSKIMDSGPDKDGVLKTKLLVPSDQAGCLIGKGGSIIAEMRKLTHAKIWIYGKEHLPPCALENDKLVQIIGNANVSHEALLQVTSRLRGNLFHGKFGPTPLDSKNLPFSGPVPHSEGPLASGMGMIPGAATFGRYHSPFPDMPLGIKGQQPSGPLSGPWPQKDIGFTGFSAHPKLDGTGEVARSNATRIASTTVEVVVPEHAMGSILGENGSNLAQIREISGAKVKVHMLAPGASERVVEISGTPDKTHAAQSLLQAFILSGQ